MKKIIIGLVVLIALVGGYLVYTISSASMCGGIASIACQDGYVCKLTEKRGADRAGKCIPDNILFRVLPY